MEDDTRMVSRRRGISASTRLFCVMQGLLSLLALLGLQVFSPQSKCGILFLGVILAQVNLLIIWATLIRTASSRRLAAGGMFVVIFAMIACIAGPSVLFALPLAFARIEGMRVVRFQAGELPTLRPMQYSMSYLLRLTFVIALLFGGAQLSRNAGPGGPIDLGGLEIPLSLMSTLVVGLTCVAIVVSIPLVCVWATLSPDAVLPRWAMAAAGWMLGGALLVHFTRVKLSHIDPILAISGVAVAVLLALLVVLRWLGYRVVWHGDTVRVPGPDTSKAGVDIE